MRQLGARVREWSVQSYGTQRWPRETVVDGTYKLALTRRSHDFISLALMLLSY